MKKLLLLVTLVLIVFLDAQAQCAMCKSVVESNLENGDSIGRGLNDGILYLMGMPYVALAIIALLLSRHNRRAKRKAELS